jgi:hypothetical protein
MIVKLQKYGISDVENIEEENSFESTTQMKAYFLGNKKVSSGKK